MIENESSTPEESPAGEDRPAGAAETEVARDLTRRVEVGGITYTIGRFRGFKATRVLKAAGQIAKAYPEIQRRAADFERDYTEGKALRLGRTEAEMRFGDEAREISEAAWQSSDNVLPMRRLPSVEERIAAVFPELVDAAEQEVLRLLALVSMTNEELKAADQGDQLEEKLAERASTLLHDGDLVELVELAKAGVEVGRAQLAPLEGMAGKVLPAIFGRRIRTEEEDLEETTPTESTTSPTSSSSSETSPPSSSDSPAPSDGAETPSSSTSHISSSDALQAA